MRLEKLRIQGLRCLDQVDVSLLPGINVFAGPNGAGKTSVLEACFLLSHARSFRSGARDALLQRGRPGLSVFAELRHDDQRLARVGLGKEGVRWDARLDGERAVLGALLAECAVVCFEPGSHALIAGGAEERRRYLDWGVFPVEHDFLAVWRRYQRALKQRNSLLRSAAVPSDDLLAPWEQEMASAAAILDAQRQRYAARLVPALRAQAGRLLPELGELDFRYRRGWAEGALLEDVLAESRGRDVARGHSTQGAHRAEWSVSFAQAPQREHLSRGQEKLTALACLLAQAALYAAARGEWPVICLDDLASELDLPHQTALVGQLVGAGAQVLVTGTELPAPVAAVPHRLFHVEQGQVSPLL